MLSEAFLKTHFQTILEGIDYADTSDYDWYRALITEGVDYDDFDNGVEETLSQEGIKYPALHNMMAQIVDKITQINRPEDAVSINEEQAAGACFAFQLAIYDECYIPLLAKHYQSGDPDHTEPEYYEEYITALFNRYGWSRAIYPLIFALFFVSSQHVGEFFTEEHADELAEHLHQDNNMELFFLDLIEWTKRCHYGSDTFEHLIALLSTAIDLDLDDEELVESVTKKFTQAIIEGRVPTLNELK